MSAPLTDPPSGDHATSAQRPSQAQPTGATWAAMFDLSPPHQQSAQSWYRAPMENPFLAYWDDVLKPWRTYTPHPWPMTTPSYSTPADPSAILGITHAAWTHLLEAQANFMRMAVSTVDSGSEPMRRSQSRDIREGSPPPGFAVAHIRFPDDTEMTITIPFPLPGYMLQR